MVLQNIGNSKVYWILNLEQFHTPKMEIDGGYLAQESKTMWMYLSVISGTLNLNTRQEEDKHMSDIAEQLKLFKEPKERAPR